TANLQAAHQSPMILDPTAGPVEPKSSTAQYDFSSVTPAAAAAPAPAPAVAPAQSYTQLGGTAAGGYRGRPNAFGTAPNPIASASSKTEAVGRGTLALNSMPNSTATSGGKLDANDSILLPQDEAEIVAPGRGERGKQFNTEAYDRIHDNPFLAAM